MADVHSREQGSRNMAAIKGKNTKPEMIVRGMLHSMGYRYRLHVKTLPGKPDIVLPRHRTIVEVRGCFWHSHQGCGFATRPATRKDFWAAKLADTVKRDDNNDKSLREEGWKVIIVWECEVRNLIELRMRLEAALG